MIERPQRSFRDRLSAASHVERCSAPGSLATLVAVAVLLLAAGCSAAKLPKTPDSPTAAVVGSRTITLQEVDEAIGQALFDQRFPTSERSRLFDARQAMLDQMVDDEVVAQAAAGSGLEPAVWLAREVEGRYPVEEDDIDAFWQQYEHRLPKDRPAEEIRAEIREYLAEENAKEVVFELRRSARVRMVLTRPRHSVEGRGVPRGPADAPITIVEFSDFECPYCLRANSTIQELLSQFPEEIRFYYRHLPLPNHRRARPAAIASVCAGRQGEFWSYHDLLFENQRALGDDDLKRYAEQLELDMGLYETCLQSPEAGATIDKDVAAANALGVTGTPAFFVNGVMLKGAQPLSKFVRIIDEELAALAGE